MVRLDSLDGGVQRSFFVAMKVCGLLAVKTGNTHICLAFVAEIACNERPADMS
jgi:hypothetical protein